MFKTLRPTAVPLLQVLLVCGQLVFSALAMAAPVEPPLHLLHSGKNRLVEGTVTLTTPEKWTVRPERFTFRLKPGEISRQEFELTLPNNASTGPQLPRIISP